MTAMSQELRRLSHGSLKKTISPGSIVYYHRSLWRGWRVGVILHQECDQLYWSHLGDRSVTHKSRVKKKFPQNAALPHISVKISLAIFASSAEETLTQFTTCFQHKTASSPGTLSPPPSLRRRRPPQ